MLKVDKIKIYRLLGAEQFQKVVFKLEEIKYLIIERLFPNVSDWYQKLCDKRYNQIIDKQNADKNLDMLEYFQYQKMLFRKEIIYKQNRNYHYDPNNPTQFIKYLSYNKKIHVRGLIKDVFLLLSLGVLSLLIDGIPLIVFAGITTYEIISLVINFECINLQNYNMCRFENERMKVLLEKMEHQRVEANIKQYGECIKPVSEAVKSQIELPTIDDVIAQITTREQAVQLLKYAKQQLAYLENDIEKKKRR